MDSSVATVQGFMTAYDGHGFYRDALEGYLFQLHGHTRIATKVLRQLDGLFYVASRVNHPSPHMHG